MLVRVRFLDGGWDALVNCRFSSMLMSDIHYIHQVRLDVCLPVPECLTAAPRSQSGCPPQTGSRQSGCFQSEIGRAHV